jgi:hypothetical protein
MLSKPSADNMIALNEPGPAQRLSLTWREQCFYGTEVCNQQGWLKHLPICAGEPELARSELAKKLSLNGYTVWATVNSNNTTHRKPMMRKTTSAPWAKIPVPGLMFDQRYFAEISTVARLRPAMRDFGHIDLLVNNAGVFIPSHHLHPSESNSLVRGIKV